MHVSSIVAHEPSFELRVVEPTVSSEARPNINQSHHLTRDNLSGCHTKCLPAGRHESRTGSRGWSWRRRPQRRAVVGGIRVMHDGESAVVVC